MSTTTVDPQLLARAATRLAQDYPALLTLVASVRATTTGTIGRSSTEPGIPGGVGHHDLSREVRDVLWAYAEVAQDVAALDGPLYSNAIFANGRTIAAHAEALADVEVLPCAGHEPPLQHASVTDHLECVDDRLRARVEPPGAREFVGPCPEVLAGGGTTCGLDLRAYDAGPARCPAGHVHQADAVRAQAVADVGDRLLTLRQVADVAPRLTDRPITLRSLQLRVQRGSLTVARRDDETGAALVRWPDVRASYRLG